MRRAIFIAVWLACCGCLCDCAAAQSPVYGSDLNGRPITRLDGDLSDRAVVLFFLATDCPISNRYVPEIQRLEKEFSGRVTLWLVYPNAGETAQGVTAHQAAFGLSAWDERVLLHPTASLMQIARATITPESAVLIHSDSGLRAAYLGRIDDRYVDIGRERPQATRHDLERAVDSALNHEVIAPPGGPPVGCGIVSEEVLRSGAGKP